MEHIKTPVDVKFFSVGQDDGTWRDTWWLVGPEWSPVAAIPRDDKRVPDSEELANEIAIALNERDDLIKQRDALVAACELLYNNVKAMGYGGTSMRKVRIALALVKGDQKSDDATT